MHGALHWWNRLNRLADINAILAAVLEASIERLFRAAETRVRVVLPRYRCCFVGGFVENSRERR
jgi:hypothetical protein